MVRPPRPSHPEFPLIYLSALLIGIVAGLRAFTAPAAVAWAAWLGWLLVGESWAWFMGHWITPWIFSVLAVVELVNDQRPSTPSRKAPTQFGARLIMGALHPIFIDQKRRSRGESRRFFFLLSQYLFHAAAGNKKLEEGDGDAGGDDHA